MLLVQNVLRWIKKRLGLSKNGLHLSQSLRQQVFTVWLIFKGDLLRVLVLKPHL
jgi:hypothetical protein